MNQDASGMSKEKEAYNSPLQECSSEEELKEYLELAGEKLVVLYFTAPWCGPCKLTGKTLEAIAAEENDITFLKVDGSEMEDTMKRFQVQVLPTFCFVRNNEAIDRYIGGKLDSFQKLLEKMKEIAVPATKT